MAMCKVSSVHFSQQTSVVGAEHDSRSHWAPNTDVYATDEGLVIKVELAGMRSENLQITVEGNKLRIAGERPDGCRAAKFNFLSMEIYYGPFENVLELPPGYDLTQAKASYLNGFLRIDVPQAVPSPLKHTKVAVTGK
ncbi:MAG TPA: Hsp20/alpha crystallin family protein [Verrucomicrobiae bacterium]|jgi:HSP20 family protein|nr:Hsp20/alpha crystallin family protein [Verrucomicrobiae bacterium]